MSLSGLACCGCGAGLGALAATLLQQQDEPSTLVKSRSLSNVGGARLAPGGSSALAAGAAAAAAKQTTLDKDCAWVNAVVAILWPRVDGFLKQLVVERITPAIDEALPTSLRGSVKVDKISVGHSVPHFGPLTVQLRGDEAIVLTLGIDIASDLHVKIHAMRMPLGIQAFTFHGLLTVCLRPACSKPPFVGGVEIYFVNPPQLDIDFTGIADIADWQVVKSAIREAITTAISAAMVLPGRLAVDLVDDDEVTMTDLKCPEPIGVLRVVLQSGKDLRADDIQNFTGKKSSDPYVVIEIGQHRWKSKTVSSSVNPAWSQHNIADFPIYDIEQVVNLKVFDHDNLSTDDLLGQALRMPLSSFALGVNFQDVAVDLSHKSKGAGSLSLRTRWFDLSPKAPVHGICQSAAEGPSQLIVAARIEDLDGVPFPGTSGSAGPYHVRMKLECPGWQELQVTSSASSKPPAAKKPQAEQLRGVCANLVRRHFAPAEIAVITGLKEEEVKAMTGAIDASADGAAGASATSSSAGTTPKRGTATKLPAAEEPLRRHHFGTVLRLLLPWTSDMIHHGHIVLEVLDKSRRTVADHRMKLADVAAKEHRGPFSLPHGATLDARLYSKWFVEPAAVGAEPGALGAIKR